MHKKESILPILSGITTSSIFGLSFLFSKKALDIVDPFPLLSFRFLTAFVIMSLLIVVKVIKVNYHNKNLKNLFFLGLMQPIIYFLFESFGIKYSSSSEAGIMIALIPIFVAIASAYFLKEKPSKAQWFFIVFSVLGVMFIVFMNGANNSSGNLLGILFLLGAVFSATVFNILSRKLSTEFSPMELTYFMMGLGALFFNGVSVVQHLQSDTLNAYFKPLSNMQFISSIAYLGILSSIIAFFLINFTLSKIEASKSAVFSNLSTIVSIIAGVVFLKENFQYYHVIGSIMILTGVWGTNYFGQKNKPTAPLTSEEKTAVDL